MLKSSSVYFIHLKVSIVRVKRETIFTKFPFLELWTFNINSRFYFVYLSHHDNNTTLDFFFFFLVLLFEDLS